MKRAIALMVALLLLSGCGAVQSAPTEPTTEATIEPTTETTTAPAMEAGTDDRRPFSESDIWRIIPREADGNPFELTVADFVEHVPASWYLVTWDPEIGYVHVSFYDHKPSDDWQNREDDPPFLTIKTTVENVSGYASNTGHGIVQIVQKLSKALLATPANVLDINFAKVDTILTPRGIKIGDSVQDIFNEYYGGQEEYKLTDVFHPDYTGSGRITDDCIVYSLSKYGSEGSSWALTYHIDENGVIKNIEYKVWHVYT